MNEHIHVLHLDVLFKTWFHVTINTGLHTEKHMECTISVNVFVAYYNDCSF